MVKGNKRTKFTLVFILIALLVMLGLGLCACSRASMNIEFVVNGETLSTSDISSESFKVVTPPDKEGFEFQGWYIDDGVWEIKLTKEYIKDNSGGETTVIVYAYYKEQILIIVLPEIDFESKTVLYDGEMHSVEITGSLDEEMTVSYRTNGISGNSMIKAGLYRVEAIFYEHEAFNDEGEYAKIVVGRMVAMLIIEQALVDTPEQRGTPEFTNNHMNVELVNHELFEVVEGGRARSPGEYTAKVMLVDFNNYKWRETDSIYADVVWTIDKGRVAPPTDLWEFNIEETGRDIIFTLREDSDYTVVSAEIGKEPGDYKVVLAFRLSELYEWTVPDETGAYSTTWRVYTQGIKLGWSGTHLVKYEGSNAQNIILPTSIESIGASAFIYCDDITSVTIPNSVMSIGKSAFYGCTSLTIIYIKRESDIGMTMAEGWNDINGRNNDGGLIEVTWDNKDEYNE